MFISENLFEICMSDMLICLKQFAGRLHTYMPKPEFAFKKCLKMDVKNLA